MTWQAQFVAAVARNLACELAALGKPVTIEKVTAGLILGFFPDEDLVSNPQKLEELVKALAPIVSRELSELEQLAAA